MIELFKQIAEVQPKLAGWCTPEKASVLASIIVCYRPALSVEIGIFAGSSFIPMALAHKAIGVGMILGIEPWDKKAAIEAQTTNEDRAWWDAQDLESICATFMENLHHLGLDNVSKIVRKKSDDVDVPPQIGLLHVDGAHSDQAVRDTVRFAQQVMIGGFVVMDDENWHGGGVQRAILRLTQMGFKRLYPLGTGAVFQRVR